MNINQCIDDTQNKTPVKRYEKVNVNEQERGQG